MWNLFKATSARVDKWIADTKRKEVLDALWPLLILTDTGTYFGQLPVIRKWCETARAELLPVAFDVATHPPSHLPYNMDEEDCRYYMAVLLGEWADCKPELWVQVAAPLLQDKLFRPIVLEALCNANIDAHHLLPEITTFIENPAELSQDEQFSLVAIVGSNVNLLPFLLQLEERIEDEKVRQEIQLYKSNREANEEPT